MNHSQSKHGQGKGKISFIKTTKCICKLYNNHLGISFGSPLRTHFEFDFDEVNGFPVYFSPILIGRLWPWSCILIRGRIGKTEGWQALSPLSSPVPFPSPPLPFPFPERASYAGYIGTAVWLVTWRASFEWRVFCLRFPFQIHCELHDSDLFSYRKFVVKPWLNKWHAIWLRPLLQPPKPSSYIAIQLCSSVVWVIAYPRTNCTRYRGAAEGLKTWPCLGQKKSKIHTLSRTTPSILGPCLGRRTIYIDWWPAKDRQISDLRYMGSG